LFFHAAFKAGLMLRQMVGVGTPRRLQDAVGVDFLAFFHGSGAAFRSVRGTGRPFRPFATRGVPVARFMAAQVVA